MAEANRRPEACLTCGSWTSTCPQHQREFQRMAPRSDDLKEEEGQMRTEERVMASARKHRPSLHTIEENAGGVMPINHSSAVFTPTAARQKVCTSFAPLPREHNTGSHELLLSRQRTPYTPGPSMQANAPIQATRSPVWNSPRKSRLVSERIGHWFHLGSTSLRNRIDQQKIWLQERFKALPKIEAEEKEHLINDRETQYLDRGRGPTVTEEVDSDFSFLWSRVPDTAVLSWY